METIILILLRNQIFKWTMKLQEGESVFKKTGDKRASKEAKTKPLILSSQTPRPTPSARL